MRCVVVVAAVVVVVIVGAAMDNVFVSRPEVNVTE